jgi:hypothetical protein
VDSVFIEESKEDEDVEQQSMETHAMQMDTWEDDVIEVEVYPPTKVQVMIEAQLRVMEIEMCELDVVVKRRRAFMDKATLLKKGIRIPDCNQFMWIQTKKNYNRHVERMEK